MPRYKWTIKAPANQGFAFTGNYYGVSFESGLATVDKKYYADLLTRNRCRIVNRVMVDAHWNPTKILVVRLGAYGDNLMITSAIHGLRNKFPDASIHFFGMEPHNSILINNPDINGIIRAPVQELGHIIDDYDEVYDLFQHIEHNPESDYKNAYDLAETRLEVNDYLGPHEHKPIFHPTQTELTRAKQILEAAGFTEKLILIHAESSSIIRRISIQTALQVSSHFIDKGYKILFAGHDIATPNMEFKECDGCGKTIAAEIFGSEKTSFCCPSCKTFNTIKKTDWSNNILFLHQMLGEVDARVIFTMQKFVDLVIAVDSAHSHIAAALEIPSVLIYGPFDPYLRAKYYNKARVVFNATSCGPCHQLAPTCVIYPKGPPPCMTQYSADTIIKEAEKALLGDFSKDEWTIPKVPSRDCPLCIGQDTKTKLISRKGNFFYEQCQACKSIFINPMPKLEKIYDKQYIAYHEHNTDLYYSRFANTLQQVADAHDIKGRDYLDVGCGEGHLMSAMSKLGWNVEGMDSRHPHKQCEGPILASLDHIDKKFDLISIVHVIEHVEDPETFISSVSKKLKNNGVLFLYGHDAARYSGNNSWLPINTKFVGEHLQIMPSNIIEDMITESGLKILHATNFGKFDLMITAQKV